MLRSSYAAAVLLAAGLLAVAGCAVGPPSGRVSGKVLLAGKPVTGGEVQFYRQDRGVGAGARIDSSGSYVLETPLEVGDYAVCVVPPPPEPLPPGAPRAASAAPSVPKKYQQYATSGLVCAVQPGRNEFPIEMKN